MLLRGREGMRLAVILLLIANTVYSQSVFRFIGKGRKLRVERRIETRVNYHNLARKVLGSEKLTVTQREILRSPMRVVGPNRYLRGIGKRFKGQEGWEKVNSAKGYNGAHHIVTRFVIKEIGGSSECINNAPSVFHPLHNHPEYIDYFHNHTRQLELYKQGGISAIMQDFFDNVGKDFTDAEKEQLMLEAELWAKHWGLKW